MNFVVLILVSVIFYDRNCLAMAKTKGNASDSGNELTLDTVRDSLIRQEDTIVFSLIERARFPLNSPTYQESNTSIPGFGGSLIHYFAKESESIQAKVISIFYLEFFFLYKKFRVFSVFFVIRSTKYYIFG